MAGKCLQSVYCPFKHFESEAEQAARLRKEQSAVSLSAMAAQSSSSSASAASSAIDLTDDGDEPMPDRSSNSNSNSASSNSGSRQPEQKAASSSSSSSAAPSLSAAEKAQRIETLAQLVQLVLTPDEQQEFGRLLSDLIGLSMQLDAGVSPLSLQRRFQSLLDEERKLFGARVALCESFEALMPPTLKALDFGLSNDGDRCSYR